MRVERGGATLFLVSDRTDTTGSLFRFFVDLFDDDDDVFEASLFRFFFEVVVF